MADQQYPDWLTQSLQPGAPAGPLPPPPMQPQPSNAPPAPYPTQEDIQKFVSQRQGVIEQGTQRMESLDAQRMALASQGTRVPKPANLQNIPAPPQDNYQNVFKESSAGLIFATLMGSLISRQHGLGAITAATGYMEGFHEGDKEKIERNRQKWQDNVDKVIKQNEVEKSRYDMVFNNAQLSQRDKMAQINAIAASIGDQQMMTALKAGQVDFAYRLPQDRNMAAQKLYEAQKKFEATQAGIMTPEAVKSAADYWKTTGKMPPGITRGGKVGQQNMAAIQQQIADDVLARGGTMEQVAREQQVFQARAAGLRTLEQRQGRVLQAVLATDEIADLLHEASEAVPRGQFKIINQGTEAVMAQASDPRLTRFDATINALANTYANGISGGYQPRIADKENFFKIVNRAMGTGAIDAAVDQIKREMAIEMHATRKAMKELGGDANIQGESEAPVGGTPTQSGGGNEGWSIQSVQ